MPLSSSNAVRQLSDGNSQGTSLGKTSADPISFYGATPVARLAGGVALSTLTVSSVLATSGSPASSGVQMSTFGYCFSSEAQANAIVTGLNASITDVTRMWNILRQMRGHLNSTGVFTGS